MQPPDEVNPYASPATVGSSPVASDAERQIRVVIRVFRLTGWPLLILFGGIVVLVVLTILTRIVADGVAGKPLPAELIPGPSLLAIAGIGSISVASQLARRKPGARWQGYVLSLLMLLGFPVFTIVGVSCFLRIRRDYREYCEECFGARDEGAPSRD
jgi:hypothetical protein